MVTGSVLATKKLDNEFLSQRNPFAQAVGGGDVPHGATPKPAPESTHPGRRITLMVPEGPGASTGLQYYQKNDRSTFV
ncbi:hypothetical protein EVAR_14241_1 [Eumeta japonica]|uniref:Uncharacterized protein n=1 Tax=Eumeta variegata TaxID=151549 RepID=A0A4C1WA18_EUMVA|nr:hypothetical protein EVAR_14241_1 [Eumeta japonica]